MRLRTQFVSVLGLLTLVGLAGGSLTAQQAPDLTRAAVFRDIGPTRQGNRYIDFAVVERRETVRASASP